MTTLTDEPVRLFDRKGAEKNAATLRDVDPIWQYIVKPDVVESGQYVIAVYDQAGKFLGHF